MAGSSDDQRGREIEEHEVVSAYRAGSGSDTDTDHEEPLQPRGGPAGMISAASSLASAGTIADDAGSHVMAIAQEAAKEEDKVAVAAVGGGGASAVEEVGESVSVSVADVVTEPKVSDDTATPVQSACGSNLVVNGGGSGSSSARSSVEPGPIGAAAPHQAPVAPPPAPAPQEATFPFIPLMVPAPQQLPGGVDLPLALHFPEASGPIARPAGRGFSCRECGRWFATHQGLGGHAAGHKNRRLAAEAAAAAAAGIDSQAHLAGRAVPEKTHECKICGAEYKSGVSLGGHMRKHYAGKPIVPRKRMRLSRADLALALPLQQVPPAAPPQVPSGSVRLFGVTIQATKEEKEPPVEDEH